MSTIKTVLTTASVLFLGAAITAGYQVSVYQQNQIDTLQNQLTGLQDQIVSVQKQTTRDNARLSQTIKATNKNFKTVSDEQDELRDTVLGIITILKSSPDSTPAPTTFTQSNNRF